MKVKEFLDLRYEDDYAVQICDRDSDDIYYTKNQGYDNCPEILLNSDVDSWELSLDAIQLNVFLNDTPSPTTNPSALINTAMADISDIQDKLNNMLRLQMNIGGFMDDVKQMSPIKDMDSVMRVQIGRDDAICYTNVVLDYLNTIINMMNTIGNTLDEAFKMSKTGGAAA